MKAFCLIIFLACSFKTGNDHDWYRLWYKYQVEVYGGLTLFGSSALILNQEGLIMRRESYDSLTKDLIVYRRFIEFDSIQIERLVAFNQFMIRHNGLIDLSEKFEDYGKWFNYPRQYVVRGGINNYFKLIIDKNYNERRTPISKDEVLLDSMMLLMNDMIPEEYKEFRM